MSYVMKCVGLAGLQLHGAGVPLGEYLMSFDPEFAGGVGAAWWTTDLDKAMRFDSFLEAWELYQTRPVNHPTRSDGQPNRPLTAYTVEISQTTTEEPP